MCPVEVPELLNIFFIISIAKLAVAASQGKKDGDSRNPRLYSCHHRPVSELPMIGLRFHTYLITNLSPEN